MNSLTDSEIEYRLQMHLSFFVLRVHIDRVLKALSEYIITC